MIWNCETTHQWGFDVASGHLDAETRASWDLHAQQCLVCRREVDVLGDMLGRRREPDAPEEILRDVFVALRPEIDCATRPPKRDNRRFVWPVFFALLGSAALLVFFSLQVDPEASVAQVVRVANRSLSWDPTESAYLLTGIGVGDRV
ncbi:MAG: hypothetical protein KDE58_26155, partial [Caldilineaceae bacterium]|nr:hypothetical protein [Caldilineaceae bacterium]